MDNLPEAVRKQGEVADKAMEKISSGEVVDVIIDSPHGVQPAVEKPVAPVVQPTDDGGWEHKYNVLQGISNNQAESINRLSEQVNLANSTVENLNSIIASMQTNPARGNGGEQPGGDDPFKPPEQGKDLSKSLNPENFGGYGDEMVDMVNTVNSLVKENRDLKAQLGNVSTSVHETRQVGFFGQMDLMVPNWRTINQEPGFVNWLKQSDPFSGLLRHDVLQNHFNAADSDKVAYIFTTWANENNYPIELPADAGAVDNNAINETLLNQEVPGQGAGPGGGSPLEPETQMITRTQFSQYATQAAQGKISEEKFAKISAQFQKLIREGKI